MLFRSALLFQLAAVLRRPRLDGWLNLGTVVAVGVVYGRFGAVALHVERVFGPMTGQQTMGILGGLAAALPWVLFFPIARLIQAPPGRIAAVAPLALLPALAGLRPYEARAEGIDAPALAEAAWNGWKGGGWTAPEGATLRLTPVRAGVPKAPATGAKGTAALGTPPSDRDALLVDLAITELPYGFIRPGTDAPLAGGSPHLVARSLKRTEVLPGFSVPTLGAGSLRWRTFLASDAGVIELDRGWSSGPELTAANIDAAVRAAAAHLIHNMGDDGQFTYIVRGPSGEGTRGYNYPRHAEIGRAHV